ncbi:hypothetical protein J2T58_002019 [Methanocalculus alkaliphilus]|uniref:hypothetical protein n=1 Tax=Methanocalculus alkaliphilus TaxID=768730 RepID=UPI00209F3E95|nr:hypothetical protein [Methanocalculus alkaliphilus]MCP1716144.1 hypothetical protein [Methanocalculus alkaliphilus]
MAGLNEDGQWIVLMGFLISISLLFLMLIVSQATLVGQTTAEGVLEFPKHEIRDLRGQVISSVGDDSFTHDVYEDMRLLSLKRNHAIISVDWRPEPDIPHMTRVMIRYNNGVTVYEETLLV